MRSIVDTVKRFKVLPYFDNFRDVPEEMARVKKHRDVFFNNAAGLPKFLFDFGEAPQTPRGVVGSLLRMPFKECFLEFWVPEASTEDDATPIESENTRIFLHVKEENDLDFNILRIKAYFNFVDNGQVIPFDLLLVHEKDKPIYVTDESDDTLSGISIKHTLEFPDYPDIEHFCNLFPENLKSFEKATYLIGFYILGFIERLSCSNVSFKKAEKPKLKKGQRLQQRIGDDYYVLYVTNERTVYDNECHTPTGRTVREHIRRGHSRRQHYKDGVVKKIWINSVLVKPGSKLGTITKDYALV